MILKLYLDWTLLKTQFPFLISHFPFLIFHYSNSVLITHIFISIFSLTQINFCLVLVFRCIYISLLKLKFLINWWSPQTVASQSGKPITRVLLICPLSTSLFLFCLASSLPPTTLLEMSIAVIQFPRISYKE